MPNKEPPEDKQFQPGESGNLNGRPKGTKNYSTRLKELLKGISGDDGEWTSPLAAEKIKIIFSKHKDGEHKGEYIYPVNERQKAIDSVADRIEGTPKQSMDLKGEIIGNIIINRPNKHG